MNHHINKDKTCQGNNIYGCAFIPATTCGVCTY
uniref:Uncharacterized protein n=1 Tax=Arundo donax TaxID=35708 RepID=A0A0A9HQJ4_ARUDO